MPVKTVTQRGQSKTSSDLAILIDAANRDQQLPDPKELFSGTKHLFRISKFLKSLSAKTRAFLGEPNNVELFRDRYDALRSAQQILPSLAEEWPDDEPSGPGFTSLPSVGVNLYIDNGMIAASGTFLNALQGVRADRIRRCNVCRNIFWAPRVNSECCTEKCRKTYNKRNSRAAQKELASEKRNARKGR